MRSQARISCGRTVGIAPVRRHAGRAGLQPAGPLPQREQAHVLHLVHEAPVIGIRSACDRHDVLPWQLGRNCPAAGARASTLIKTVVTIPGSSLLCVNRIQKTLILVAAVALPAAAHSTFAPTRETLCFASGATTYQIARNAAAPDFRIKIADASAKPDLRMRLVDSAENGRFRAGRRLQRRGAGALPLLDADPHRGARRRHRKARRHGHAFGRRRLSDYKIYVHSVRFSQQDAAALLAAMWKTDQRREATGSIR